MLLMTLSNILIFQKIFTDEWYWQKQLSRKTNPFQTNFLFLYPLKMSPEIGQWNHTENQLRNIKQVTYINSTLHKFEELEHLKIHVTVFFRESFYSFSKFVLGDLNTIFSFKLLYLQLKSAVPLSRNYFV